MTSPEVEQQKKSSRRRQVPSVDPVEPSQATPAVEAVALPVPVLVPPTDTGVPPSPTPVEVPVPAAAPIPMEPLAPPPKPTVFGGFTPAAQSQVMPNIQTPAPPRMVAPVAAGAFGPLPDPGPCFPGTEFHRFDVVQILEPESRLYGGFLIVADILGDKVHGYYFTEGKQRQHATVRIQYCWPCGTSRVRFQNPCSPKWISDNRPQPSQ